MFIKKREDDINAVLKRVKKFEEKNKLDDAIVELQRAIQLNGKDGNLYNQLGDLFLRTGSTDEAVNAYRQGVRAYRRETFPRNALALCKKIARCDPRDVDVYYDMGDLSLELDEKSEANLPSLRTTGVTVAPGTTHVAARPTEGESAIKQPASVQSTVQKTLPSQKPGPDSAAQFDAMVKRLEAVIAQLQETVRLDQIAATLKNAIEDLSHTHGKASDEQRKTIGLLQKSFALNIDTLQKSINSFTDSSTKDRKKHVVLLTNLKSQLESIGKVQDAVVQQLGEKMENAGKHFTAASRAVVSEVNKVVAKQSETNSAVAQEVEKLLTGHEQATKHICSKLDEHKEYNRSLAENTEEVKARVQEISQCLMDFIAAQKCMQHKQQNFAKMVLAVAGAIAALLAVSIFI